MKAPLLLCVFLWALPCFASDPSALNPESPAPTPPARLEAAQAPAPAPQIVYLPAPASTSDKITAWGLIATAAITALFGLVGFALKKCIELKPLVEQLLGRADRQAAKTGSLENRVTNIALATPAATALPQPDIVLAPDSPPPASATGAPSRVPAIVAAMGLAAALGLLAACATNTGDPTKDRRGRITNAIAEETFNAVLQVGLASGRNALMGRNGQDAAAAAFESVGQIDGAAALEHVLRAAAGPQIAPVARVAAEQFAKAAPQTPAEKALVINTIGAAIQQAANQAQP